MARRVVKSLKEPFEVQGLTLAIGASVGITMFPAAGAESYDMVVLPRRLGHVSGQGGRDGAGSISPLPRARRNRHPVRKSEPRRVRFGAHVTHLRSIVSLFWIGPK